MGKRIPLADRFWSKVREDGDCWVWIGSTGAQTGYGRFQVDYKIKYAHRVAYELMIGEIPEGLQLDHLCRNRACVNPYHLDPVTAAENIRRSPVHHANKTHCAAGHEYAGDNLQVRRGRRVCRACNNAWSRASHAAKRAA